MALPLPLAALGMYLFLERAGKPPRRLRSAPCAFTLSGVDGLDAQHPQPGVVRRGPAVGDVDDRAAAAARARRDGAAALAVAFALQALSGEPVTGAATALVVASRTRRARPAFRAAKSDHCAHAPLEAAVGGCRHRASADCLRPASSCRRSSPACSAHRGALPTPDFWSAASR